MFRAALVSALLLTSTAYAQGVAPVQSVTPRGAPSGAVLLPDGSSAKKRKPEKLIMVRRVKGTARLTTRWCFVVDNSSSMKQVPQRAIHAFREMTSAPGDELKFSMFSFSDEDEEEFLDWDWASPLSFSRAEKWLDENEGIYSYGKSSIAKALRLKMQKLTVVIVSDGGFTSGCYNRGFSKILSTIRVGQAWRKKNGYEPAVIVTIGIQNLYYTAGGKPSDKACQLLMAKIGKEGRGGYYLVRSLTPEKPPALPLPFRVQPQVPNPLTWPR